MVGRKFFTSVLPIKKKTYKSKGQLSCFTEAKFSAWNLFELASYGKFGFSRSDLDGNKLAKGMYLARKAKDREVFI